MPPLRLPYLLAFVVWVHLACRATTTTPPRPPHTVERALAREAALLDLRPATVTLRLGDRTRAIPGLAQEVPRVQIGGRRAELREGRWRFSDDRVLRPIAAAVALDGAWVFVTEDGLVVASDDFLGPLRRLGEVAPFRQSTSWTRGRVPLVTDDALYTTDGAALVRAGATPAPVRHAAFADTNFGAAVLTDGALMITRDGGVTWTPVALGADVALLVTFHDGALHVLSSRGTQRLDRDGALTMASSSRAADSTSPTLAELPDLATAWRAREPVPEHGDVGHARLPDGSFVAAVGGVVRHLDAQGRVLSTRTLGIQCHAKPWGTAVGVDCGEIYRTEDGETYEAILRPERGGGAEHPASAVVFDEAGARIAVEGRCHEAARDTPRDAAVCVRDGHGTWREFALPEIEGSWSLQSLRDASLLVVDHGAPMRAAVLDLARSTTTPVAIEGVASAPLHDGDFSWSPDGTLRVIYRAGDAPVALAVGRSDAPLRPVALPEGAITADFADARRGVALGERFGVLWRTLDGGAHWEVVPSPIDRGELAPRMGAAPPLRCDARGCSAGGFLFLTGWGELTPPRERVLVGAQGDRRRDERSPLALPDLRCTRGDVMPLPRDRGAVHELGFVRTTLDNDRVRTLAWRGDHAQGTATPRALTTRELILLGFGAGALVATAQGLQWLRGAQTTIVASPPGLRGSLDRALVEALPDGGLVALLPSLFVGSDSALRGDGPLAQRYDFAVALRADGTLLARRARVVDELAPGFFARGIGRVAGRWGHATVSSDGTVTFALLGVAVPTTLPTLSGRLSPCTAQLPALVDRLLLRSHRLNATVDGVALADARVEVALSPAGACLRALAWTSDDNTRTVLVGAGDAMRGDEDADRGRTALRCEVVP